MRTTINIPDDLYYVAKSIAKDTSMSLSETVAELLRRAIGTPKVLKEFSVSSITGLPQIRLNKIITAEDIRSLEDE